MAGQYPQESLIVSRQAFESDEPWEIVASNVNVLNAQFGEHLREDEVSENSLRSYYVDYFLSEFQNGGFSQFVYNSRWNTQLVGYITEGFEAIGALKHLEAFENAAQDMRTRPGIDGLIKFFDSDYFDENEERDILNEYNDAFLALEESEDLTALNAKWLRELPELVVLSDEEIAEEIQRRATAIPDREARIAAALDAEPPYMKLIRALCKVAGHEFNFVTAGDPAFQHNGESMIAWHFITDKGHFYMVETDGKVLMFDGESDEVVHKIEDTSTIV